MDMRKAPNVLMLAGDFTEDYEVTVPFHAMQMLGITVSVVCPGKKAGDKIKTAIHDFEGDQTYTEKPGHLFVLNATFEQMVFSEYDGLFLTGGRSPEYLRLNSRVLDMTQHFVQRGKPTAAICHGVQILTAANVVRGRRVTAYETVQPEVELAGGIFVSTAASDTCVDGSLITSPAWPGNPAILHDFFKALGLHVQWDLINK